MPKFEEHDKKKLLDGSSRSSEFFLVKQNPIFDLDS